MSDAADDLEPADPTRPEAAPTVQAEPAAGAPPARRPIWKRRPWQIGAAAIVALVIGVVASLLWSLPLGRALEPLPIRPW